MSKTPSRAFILVSIPKWKSKLKYRQTQYNHYAKVKVNARKGKSKYSLDEATALKAKWSKLVYEAQSMLTLRRAQLESYRVKAVTHSDAAGRDFLRQEEGEVLHPYNDTEGHATIGVGHLIHYGNVTAKDQQVYRNFSKRDSDELFRQDLLKYEAAVAEVFAKGRLKANQNMFNALVSLTYNIGTSGFKNSTVAKEIQKGNKQKAAEAILLWNKPSVLLPRRHRERALFLKG